MRNWIRKISTVLAAILIAFGAASADRPNIVIILADDLGYGDLQCYNEKSRVPTPQLDAMARAGMRFTDAHSPSAVCSPTRYGLLTGTCAWRTELKSSVLWPWDKPLIAEGTQTLPGMLRDLGYDTACIGKWHLGWEWPTRDGTSINDVIPLGKWDPAIRDPWGAKVDFTRPVGGGPLTRGFGYYFGDDVPNFPPYVFIENDRVLGIPDRNKPETMFGSAGPMMADWDLTAVMPALVEKAVAYIQAPPGQTPFNKRADAPFFLYLPLTAPHNPIAPAPVFVGKSPAHRYGDFLMEVDWAAGRVLDALRDAGLLDHTLVIFTSDNGSPANDGEGMGGKPGSVLAYGHQPSYHFRGMKADIWEGGHRVPFVAHWPGRVPAGATSHEIITLTDLMATLASLTGASLDPDAARDSVNILPAIMGANSFAPLREATVHHSIDGMFAIRQGPWKFIDGKGSGGWTRSEEGNAPAGQLYNLSEDPGEIKNRYDERPDLVQSLSTLLERYKSEGRSVPPR